MTVGWYVHHHGHGHLHRALAIARHLGSVTGISSLERPQGWVGPWLRLARDDDRATAADPTANGALHWAPLGHDGLRERMAAVSAWIESARPDVLVVDVSVEIALLARLHGVPVVTFAIPGDRGDVPHLAGYAASSAIIAAWPSQARGLLRGVGAEVSDRVVNVGAISRYRVADEVGGVEPQTVVLLLGSGGDDLPDGWAARAREAAPGWTWQTLGGIAWVADPWPAMRSAQVVVTHAGQNALAEVAAARRPAVVVPMKRPHHEQVVTGSVLQDQRWPATVIRPDEQVDWGELLEQTAALDGARWAAWCDGDGADRAAAVVRRVGGAG